MKKLLLFFLLINISLIGYIPFASAENIKVSYFTFMIPDSPMTIENGPKGMSWSISGSPGPMPRMEMKLEGKNGDVALFGNNSITFASTWNGSTSIIPKTIGKFTLKIYVYSSNGLITATRNIEMEVKSNTQYSVSGQSSIYVGDKGTFRLNTTQYVKSTKWTLSNTNATMESQQTGSVVLVPTKAGNVTVNAEITLVSGEVRKASWYVTLNENPLKNLVIGGSGKITTFPDREVKFELSGLPAGAKTNWETDNSSVAIISSSDQSVTLKVRNSISQFRLSATATIGSLKKTVTKTISVDFLNIELEGETNVLNYGQILTYKIKGLPSNTKVNWRDPYGSIIEGQGTNQIKIRDLSSSKVTLVAEFEYLGEKMIFTKTILMTHVRGKVPEIANKADVEPFVLEIENYDLLKLKHPNVKFEWKANVFAPFCYNESLYPSEHNTDLLTQLHIDYVLGKAYYLCDKNALIGMNLSLIIDNKMFNVGRDLDVNIGDVFFDYVQLDPGINYVYVFNIPNEVDTKKIELLKVNEQYDTYNAGFGELIAGNLKSIYVVVEEVIKTDKARIKIRMHYDDGTFKDFISPIIPFKRATKTLSTSILNSELTNIQADLNKVYSVEIYTIPLGNKVYSKKGIINFDINDLLIPKGMYVIKKTDNEGNITSEKIYKTR